MKVTGTAARTQFEAITSPERKTEIFYPAEHAPSAAEDATRRAA